LGFLWLPCLLLLAVLIHYSGASTYISRDFTLEQRLLTEARVLGEYLWRWLNPFIASRGVYVDGYQLSTGLLTPLTTLPAVLLLLVGLFWALLQHKHFPRASLAILFFLAGHVLESSLLPLEVYFEHRNYLPAMLLVLPVSRWFVDRPKQRWLNLIPVTILLILALQTYKVAGIWGNELSLAEYSLEANPSSTRAIGNWAGYLERQGKREEALSVMESGLLRRPDASDLRLVYLRQLCQSKGVSPADLDVTKLQLQNHPLGLQSYPLLGVLVERVPKQCNGMSISDLESILETMVTTAINQHDYEAQRRLQHYQGILFAKNGQAEAAVKSFAGTQKIQADIDLGLNQVSILVHFKHYAYAKDWLDHIEALPLPVDWHGKSKSMGYQSRAAMLRKLLDSKLSHVGISNSEHP
jgi:protein O-mannosyl-transferase